MSFYFFCCFTVHTVQDSCRLSPVQFTPPLAEFFHNTDCRTCPRPAPFRCQSCPFNFHVLESNGSLGPKSPHPKRHLDRFSRFCRTHGRDRQTDRETDRQTDRRTNQATSYVEMGRIYLVLRRSVKEGWLNDN